MERTNNKDKDGKIQYVKLGKGSLRFKGKRIKENQKFYAYPDEIPETFKDLIKPVLKGDEIQVEEAQENIDVKPSEYKLQHRGGPWWDVVDGSGNLMNENAIRQAEALELIKTLE